MDAEILFFMTAKDQQDFLHEAQQYCDSIEERGDHFDFILGDCSLQFHPTTKDENTLYCGKFEIRLGASATACSDQVRAQSTFRKLRNWLKKHYWSRLAFLNKNKKNKLTPSRTHWLGPDAKVWKESNPEKHLLKLSRTSWMTFDIGF